MRAVPDQENGHRESEPGLGQVLSERLGHRTSRLFTRPNFELLIELVRTEFKTSDQGTILGAMWSLLGPVAALAVMHLVFHRNFGSAIPAYPLYLLLGIVVVGFFRTMTSSMMVMFPGQRNLLINTTVPGLAVFTAQASTNVSRLIAELLLCAALSVHYGLFSLRTLALLIPLLIGFLALSIGVALILCTARVFFRDAEHLWRLASRLLFFGTPVFYALDGLSPWAQSVLYWANPLTPFLLAFRDALMGGGEAGWPVVAHSLALGGVALVIGYVTFALLEHEAVEIA